MNIYSPISRYKQAEIDKAVEGNDADKLLLMVLSVALYSDDCQYAEDFCAKFSNHDYFNVRGNAIPGFAHIARIHGRLNEARIKPIIENALEDKNGFVRDQADAAMDDTEHFLKWKY